MALFLHLPVELWIKVIGFATDLDRSPRTGFAEHLLPPCNELSLRAKFDVSKVSRLFRELSLPFLYEAIEVKSQQSLKALDYALVRCPMAKMLSAHVVMLHINLDNIVNESRGVDAHDAMSKYTARILNNTTKLTALQIKLLFNRLHTRRFLSPISMQLHNDILRAIPPSVQRLDWQLSQDGKETKAVRRVASASARALRSLAMLPQHAHPEDAIEPGTGWPRFLSLTHLEIIGRCDLMGLTSGALEIPALTHLKVRSLMNSRSMVNAPVYRGVTYLEVTYTISMARDELQVHLPDLETLSCSGEFQNKEWFTTHLEHPALRNLIINIYYGPESEWPDYTLQEGEENVSLTRWENVRENLGSINMERLPSLRSVTLRFAARVVSESMTSSLIEESLSHLRNAGVLLAIDPEAAIHPLSE